MQELLVLNTLDNYFGQSLTFKIDLVLVQNLTAEFSSSYPSALLPPKIRIELDVIGVTNAKQLG